MNPVRRMADNRTKARCPACRTGDAGHRQHCIIWPGIVASTDWTRDCVLDMGDYTPNTLAAILARCNLEYWSASPTLLTDVEYDLVMRRLYWLCPTHPQLYCIGDGDGTGYARV